MTLQTDRLTMIGLGVQGDTPPPGGVQPKLVDGVHLRWMCDPAVGFPWHGFHLFRRPSGDGKPACLGDTLATKPPAPGSGGRMPAAWATPLGTLESDVALAFTEDFPPAGRREVDLRQRQWARLTLPTGRTAYRADVTLGLRQAVGQPTPTRTCVDFRTDKTESKGPNPLTRGGVTFTVLGPKNVPAANTSVRPVAAKPASLMGLDCGVELQLRIPCPAVEVELTLTSLKSPARARAVNGQGATVASGGLVPPAGQTQTIVLKGTGIVSVVITAPDDATTIHQICYRCPVDTPTTPGVAVVGLSGRTPVASATATGAANSVVTVSVRFDELTGVEIRGGPAAIIDICVWFVADGAAAGWQRLTGFPNPMGLPVRHPSYPATGNLAANLAASEADGVARVLYGTAADYQGQPFTDLHGRLTTLVGGGPTGPPMASVVETHAGTQVPSDPNAEPAEIDDMPVLDLLVLAALSPALAQVLGVYWVDQTAVPGTAYDYLVVADHTGSGQRDAQKVLQAIATSGFAQLDGWICFGLKAAPATPLLPPTGLEAYTLPDADVPPPDGTVASGHGTVGLRWSLPVAVDGGLQPGAPVLYHLWRAFLDNQSNPVGNPSYALVTTDGPALPTTPSPSAGAVPPPAADLPPFPLHALDSGLADGWYAYAVCGVDLFGRHSVRGTPAVWRQWAPPPQPRPWYYSDPPSDRIVHPSAVRVLDKTPPPAPTGVEAFALDPKDPTVVRDRAWTKWSKALDEEEQPKLVGLRVRWKWTDAHMRQAPDTAEFRIYFNVGTDPPGPDSHEPTAWDERRYVVGYGEHVTVTQDEDGKPLRRYEVLLPDKVDAMRDSLPLLPTLADPIAYGHVGVSAADGQAHTADAPKWAAAHFGGRSGNEGRVGPLAKVWRVWREPPPAPSVPVDGERAYATRADYHSRSYYTFRWTASPPLRTHVFRAMDETLFRVDWALRPRPQPLIATQLARFPPEAVDPRWNQAKRSQVAAELNALDGFDHTDDGSAKALAHYRALSDDALRILAGLPGMDEAFSQLTIDPLNPDPTAADPTDRSDRPGPDNPPNYVPRPELRIFIDALDGRSTNRHFYRAAYVDPAFNVGPLSLSGPPVWLYKVVPPRTPVVTRVTSGERQVKLDWAANREPDLAGYRVYRASTEADAADLRAMSLVASPLPPATTWTDGPGLVGGQTYRYRLTAVDTSGNESAPSRPYPAIAVDTQPPPPPVLVDRAWLVERPQDLQLVAWPAGEAVSDGHTPALRLVLTSTVPTPFLAVSRMAAGDGGWGAAPRASMDADPAAAGSYVLIDRDPILTGPSWYRVRLRSASGVWAEEDTLVPAVPPVIVL